MTEPLVSVGLPVYNGERYLETALAGLLAQDYGNSELIISDNASTDATEQICRRAAERDPRIRYHRNPHNIGANRNFNHVFKLARGTYFAWAAHDDLRSPSFLRRCVEALERRPDAVLAQSWVDFVDVDGRPYATPARDFITSSPAVRARFHACIYDARSPLAIYGVLRTRALRQTLLLPDVIGCDIVLLAELALLGPFIQVPEVLFTYRTRGFNQGESYRKRLRKDALLQRKIGSTWFPFATLGVAYLQVATRAPQPLRERLFLAADVLRWYFVDALMVSNLARLRDRARQALSAREHPSDTG